MKIVGSEVFVIGNPWKNWVLVKLQTDEGIVGWGDATQGLATKPVAAALEELRRFYIGRDPRAIERLWDEMHKGLYLTANGTLLSAMAAIETACWDILGKALGVPLYQLLGGKVRDRVRAYANGWYKGPRDPVFFAERAVAVVEMGYTALKFDPLGAGHLILDRADRRIGRAIVRAVRDAVGDEVDIIIEVHDRLTVPEAIQVGRELEEFSPLWMEAPVWSEDLQGTATVAAASNIRIADAERFTSLRSFADLLACGRIDLVLPEYVELGGLHRLRQVSALAEAYQAMVAPHNARSILSTALLAHFDIATRNVLIQECFNDFHVGWAKDIFQGIPNVVGGYLEIPDGPGLGVEVNEVAAAKHPYSDGNFLHLFRPGWEQRLGSSHQSNVT